MPSRRLLLCAAPMLACGLVRPARAGGFSAFLAGVADQARAQGISDRTITRALTGLQPNQKVLDLDRNQPEFTQTWQHYHDVRMSPTRVALGRSTYAAARTLLAAIASELQVDPGVIMGIWGMETNFGGYTGGFNVVEALATLAWDGRRASYFRPELLAALVILDEGDVSFERMLGSYAGAMGQPQFMPTSFKRYAVDFDGDGRRDIWDDKADVLASIANYLAKSGWRQGEPWGTQVQLPPQLGAAAASRGNTAPIATWARRGVTLPDGAALQGDGVAYLVMPDGDGGQAFLAYPNFAVIRRYNASDYYALIVGEFGDLVTG